MRFVGFSEVRDRIAGKRAAVVGSGVHAVMGIGGAPEGVLTAAARPAFASSTARMAFSSGEKAAGAAAVFEVAAFDAAGRWLTCATSGAANTINNTADFYADIFGSYTLQTC